MSKQPSADFDAAATRADLLRIIGYSAETCAPNGTPSEEFYTDRWLSPRLDALVEYVRARVTPHADYDAPAHDLLGRLDRSICGACGDAYVECSKCGVYFCDCSRGLEPCVIPPAEKGGAT